MKISELTDEIVANYIHIENDDPLIGVVKEAAISEACSFTGLSETELDDYEDITMAVLQMAADNYDIRTRHADKPENDRMVERILSMHSVNLLPKEDET